MILYSILSFSDLFHLVHPCCWKQQIFILFYDWAVLLYAHHIFFIYLHLLMDTYCYEQWDTCIFSKYCFGVLFRIYIPMSGIACSYGNFMFSFWETSYTGCHWACTNLNSHQQCKKAPFSTPFHRYLLFVVLYQGNISCKDGLNKGQKWEGPNRSRRY